jgi:hypothetical protein
MCCGCASVAETSSGPTLAAERQALSDSEYVAACEHRPGARFRLYGCKPIGPQKIPLFIVDGRPLPTDTIGPGKVIRERVIAGLTGDQVEEIKVLKRDEVAARNYGAEAQFGVIMITLRPQFRKASSETHPNTR